MTKDELISILELRFNEQTHALGYKILLERMEEIEEYLRPFGFRLIVGGYSGTVFMQYNSRTTDTLYPIDFKTSNSVFLNRLEELKERLP